MENKDSIELWMKTSINVSKSIKLAMIKHDDKTIIDLLKLFGNATKQLEKLIEITKKERFTA
tara:strand:+ start:325 stop:510 length:186 start_codon:yes stop_codon:yes gene_type:complete